MSIPTTQTGAAPAGVPIIEWVPDPLDLRQREAAAAPVGPVFISGDPGTGKTHTVRARVAALIVAGADPRGIAVLTRTARAAEEFTGRLAGAPRMDELTVYPFIGTFHAYASDFIRRVAAEVPGIPTDYTLWGPDQSALAVEQLALRHPELPGAGIRRRKARRLLEWHSLNRTRVDLNPIPALADDWHLIIESYTAEKRRQHALDLDDLLDISIAVLRDSPEFRDAWRQHRAQHLLIDDFQDVTPRQYELVRLLTAPDGNVTIATSRNSGMLSRRGGDRRLSERFLMEHRKAARYHLPFNHRATGSLWGVATTLQAAPDLPGVETVDQRSIRIQGSSPWLVGTDGPIAELDQKVMDTIMDHYNDDVYGWNDIALLYVDAATSRRLAAYLRAHNIPCRDLGVSIEREAPDLSAVRNLLSLAVNPHDGVALHNAVAAGLSRSQRLKISAVLRSIQDGALQSRRDQIWAARQYMKRAPRGTVVTQRLAFIMDTLPILQNAISSDGIDVAGVTHLAFNKFRDNAVSNPPSQPSADLQRFFTLADAFIGSHTTVRADICRLLDSVATMSEPMERSSWIDDPHDHRRVITLCPIHQSQGLEWPVVFLPDCVDHKIPGQRAAGDDDLLLEAQRLFYVAITRAKDHVYICCPTADEHHVLQAPSRFIAPLAPLLEVL